jgi:hypothetical protein
MPEDDVSVPVGSTKIGLVAGSSFSLNRTKNFLLMLEESLPRNMYWIASTTMVTTNPEIFVGRLRVNRPKIAE